MLPKALEKGGFADLVIVGGDPGPGSGENTALPVDEGAIAIEGEGAVLLEIGHGLVLEKAAPGCDRGRRRGDNSKSANRDLDPNARILDQDGLSALCASRRRRAGEVMPARFMARVSADCSENPQANATCAKGKSEFVISASAWRRRA